MADSDTVPAASRDAVDQLILTTIFGAISVEDYVHFTELHTRHHRKQLAGGQ